MVPLLMWSFTAITLGTGLANVEHGGVSWARYGVAVLVGVLLQGLLAHAVNEIADWRSGTDRHPAPRVVSGGSKVIGAGLLDERGLAVTGVLAALSAIGVGIAAAVVWEPAVLAFGAIGLAGAVVYTLPPIRAAYRPVVGESIAWACVWGCAVGAYVLQTGSPSTAVVLVGAAYATACVSMLQVHHLLDRVPDACARPPKRTTTLVLGDHAVSYGRALAVAALALAMLAAPLVGPALFPLIVGLAIALAPELIVDPSSPESVTRAELGVIGAVAGGGLTAAAVMWPASLWAISALALVVPIELRVSARVAAAARARTPLPGTAPLEPS